ncbi:DUF7701 domain-containing protein [[Actinomadura] parvosata]|uniref:DUF7701 domain-containing protein n=1 Tax=[Actinomadura] parvosata TaxID=1955412 RepID=UPI00406C6F25
MSYIDEVMAAIAVQLPDQDDALLRLYALLVLVKGQETTLKDVHDAWALWRHITNPDHRSMVPFEDLDEATQELDRRYMETIHYVATSLTGTRA